MGLFSLCIFILALNLDGDGCVYQQITALHGVMYVSGNYQWCLCAAKLTFLKTVTDLLSDYIFVYYYDHFSFISLYYRKIMLC
jgi:hypothetical protein